jgi:RNA polymerase sigma-70 factor (ECF subfamily)
VDEPARYVSVEQGVRTETGNGQPLEVADRAQPADQRLIDAWIGVRLRQALAHLPSAYRVILVLREIEGLSTREVAHVMGISEANVKTRLHRARLMMRARLEDL